MLTDNRKAEQAARARPEQDSPGVTTYFPDMIKHKHSTEVAS